MKKMSCAYCVCEASTVLVVVATNFVRIKSVYIFAFDEISPVVTLVVSYVKIKKFHVPAVFSLLKYYSDLFHGESFTFIFCLFLIFL